MDVNKLVRLVERLEDDVGVLKHFAVIPEHLCPKCGSKMTPHFIKHHDAYYSEPARKAEGLWWECRNTTPGGGWCDHEEAGSE